MLLRLCCHVGEDGTANCQKLVSWSAAGNAGASGTGDVVVA